jgi:outer membrane protein assembly factor BamB
MKHIIVVIAEQVSAITRADPAVLTPLTLLTVWLTPLAATPVADPSADWPQFRGARRDGIATSSSELEPWREGEPKVVWRRGLGEGFSSISVAAGVLYTQFAEGETEYAAAFAAATGAEVWRRELGSRFHGEWGSGPRSTPTVEGPWVYVLGAHGVLASLAGADGSARWSVDLRRRFGGNGPRYGHSPSPLIHDRLLVIEVGGEAGRAIAALDKKTGQVRWTTHTDRMGYSSPIAFDLDNERHFVFATPLTVVGVSAAGAVLWRWPLTAASGIEFPISMPVAVPPDRVFVSHRAEGGSVLLRLLREEGEIRLEEQWQSRFFVNHWSSSVYVNGHLYGFHNATLKSFSVESGEQNWAVRGLGKGSLIAVGGKLLVLSDRGELILAKATPGEYRELSRARVLTGSKSWTAPVFVDGRLYLRNHNEMVCLELPSRRGPGG